jgi:hypothetical protein
MGKAVVRIAKRMDREAPVAAPQQQRWTPADLLARIEEALARRAD